MDLTGVKVESGVGMTMKYRGMGPRAYMIDKPFVLWIERPNVKVPIFAGILAEDCWKEPV